VVVLLTAVTTLGGGDLFLGYTHTLAAITIAGVLITLLGVLRMGKLAEFFPASAIEGNAGCNWLKSSGKTVPHHAWA
jgi:MFS superfamily sulfate permease-like transporter